MSQRIARLVVSLVCLAAAGCGHTATDTPGSTGAVEKDAGLCDLPSRTFRAPARSSSPRPQPSAISATFSIVAMDPESGICGAAVASKFPAVGEVVPYARGGVGAFCTQHFHNPELGPRALDLLAKDKSPAEVLWELTKDDPQSGTRQLAIVDRLGRTAQLNPVDAPPRSQWWGAMSGRYYACQGNTLAGRNVITAMAAAYETTEGSLADRLMAALLAGDTAGGDHRGRLAAGIKVAKPGVEGNWLELQVDKSDDAVTELMEKYIELDHEAKGKPKIAPSWMHRRPSPRWNRPANDAERRARACDKRGHATRHPATDRRFADVALGFRCRGPMINRFDGRRTLAAGGVSSRPLKYSTACAIAWMRSQNDDASRYFAFRAELCYAPGEVETGQDGLFQRTASAAFGPQDGTRGCYDD